MCIYIYTYVYVIRLFKCRLWMAIDKPKKRGNEETPLWVGGLKTSHYWRVKSYMFHFVGPQQWVTSGSTMATIEKHGKNRWFVHTNGHFGIYGTSPELRCCSLDSGHQEGQPTGLAPGTGTATVDYSLWLAFATALGVRNLCQGSTVCTVQYMSWILVVIILRTKAKSSLKFSLYKDTEVLKAK
jgi:hypothetical protein